MLSIYTQYINKYYCELISHQNKIYFFVLVISKLISITILGVMGKEIFTIFTNPLRALIMIVLLVVLWFISKKVEKHFMGSTKE